jgi:glycerol uptake facilitator protein
VARQPVTRPVVTTIRDRFIAELIGTFLLTFVAGGAVAAAAMMLHNSGQASRPGDILSYALAYGLALIGAFAIFSRVSGAHLNPAVTVALASINRFPFEDIFPYLLAQFVGALIGAGALLLVYGTLAAHVGSAGAPVLGTNINIWQGLLAEAIGAFFWMLAFMATWLDERATPGWSALAIGAAVAGSVLAVGFAAGGSFNPARAFGSDLVATLAGGSVNWIAFLISYLVGPLVGAVLAAFAYRFVARPPRPRL